MTTRLLAPVLTLFLVACGASAPAPPTASPITTPSPVPSQPPTPAPTPTPEPSPSPGSDFYLRAWYSQALPPRETFTWLPMQTVADGLLIDGNVAVPAIYPGPMMITPMARPISEGGIEAIIEEAHRLGLLEGETDFTGGAVMPGSRTASIEMVIDGTTYTLTGTPELAVECDQTGRCEAEPGTPAAFTAFWRELEVSQMWLEPELGPANTYQPERVAMLLTQPPTGEPGIEPTPAAWPFETPIAEAGVEFPGAEGERCVTLGDEALEAMLPILQAATQLTVFVDDDGTQAGAMVRVLVPLEPSPCPDEGSLYR